MSVSLSSQVDCFSNREIKDFKEIKNEGRRNDLRLHQNSGSAATFEFDS
jgi:hypothetical protein